MMAVGGIVFVYDPRQDTQLCLLTRTSQLTFKNPGSENAYKYIPPYSLVSILPSPIATFSSKDSWGHMMDWHPTLAFVHLKRKPSSIIPNVPGRMVISHRYGDSAGTLCHN